MNSLAVIGQKAMKGLSRIILFQDTFPTINRIIEFILQYKNLV